MAVMLNAFHTIQNVADDSVLELDGAHDIQIVEFGSNRFVYVAGRVDNGIAVFSMDADGMLTALPDVEDNLTLELVQAEHLTHVNVSGTDFLLATGFSDDGISVFEINTSTGALTNVFNVSDSATLFLNGASDIKTMTVGGSTFVIVAGYNDGINVFEIDGTGALTSTDTVADNATLEILNPYAVHTAVVGGSNLVFVTGYSDHGVSVFELTATGTLTPLYDVPDDASIELFRAQGMDSVEIGGTTYLYVVGHDDDGLSIFSVASNGVLTLVDNVADTTFLNGVVEPKIVEVDGLRLLFAQGQDTDRGVAYVINADGTLTQISDVQDDAALELDGANFIDTITIGDKTFMIYTGANDDGLSVFELGGSNDPIVGTSGNDEIFGFGGDDDLLGLGGADRIYGGAGEDILSGRGGADTLEGGAGADIIIGGAGNNTVSYESSSVGVYVNLATNFVNRGDATGDTLIQIRNIRGSDERDNLRGDDSANTISGLADNDFLFGFGGDDVLNGGLGADRLLGGDGDDVLDGSNGTDFIDGGAGVDTMSGGIGNDTFQFDDGDGADEILDFDQGTGSDKLDYSKHSQANSMADISMFQLGADLAIGVAGTADSVLLRNFNIADIDAGDFVF